MAFGEYLSAGTGVTKGLYKLNWDATDSSWNANNGTASNISWTIWLRWGGGATFNGSSSKITTWAQTINTGEFFWSCWFKTTTAAAWKTVISNNNGGSYAQLTAWGTTTGNIWFEIFASTIFFTTTFSDGLWHNIAWTRLSTTSYLFYDGKLRWTATPGSNSAGSSAINIWSRPFDSNGIFTWEIDEVILENAGWTEAKYRKYYTMAKWRFGIL